MIGIPAVRHFDTGPVNKSPYELLYIDAWSVAQQKLRTFQSCAVRHKGLSSEILRE